MLALLAGLLLKGYADYDLRTASYAAKGPAAGGAAAVGLGPVAYLAGGTRLVDAAPRPRTVALTFDDGPDPRWTPRILAELRHEHVPATFFVLASRVASNPSLVAAEVAAGEEIGSDALTRTDTALALGWSEGLDLSINELALAGAVARTTDLLRPSFAATASRSDLPQLRQVTAAGYVVVLYNRDSGDTGKAGVSQIVRNSIASPAGPGVIVMLHDGGGDRSKTLRALPEIIADYRHMGYRFTTVGGALGWNAVAGMRSVSLLRHVQGDAFVAALSISEVVSSLLAWLLVPLAALLLIRALVLVSFARRHVRRRRTEEAVVYTPPVSILVPAYNEAVGITASVTSLAASDYPDFEVIVIDDGSTDGTADMVESLGLERVRVIRQQNGGKAIALNTGLAACTSEIVVMVDADTVFERETLRRLVPPLADESVGAVSGNTKVGNRLGLIGLWQHLEYVSGFSLDRRFYDVFRCMPTIPGAIGAYRRSAVIDVGWVSTDTLAEDTDLTMALQRGGHRVVYEPTARAWTETPETFSQLWRQRYRWCYGILQSAWKHRPAVVERGPGRNLGRIGLPFLICFQVLLPLLAPVVDLYAIVGLLFLNPVTVAAYWLGFLAFQLSVTAYALRLDGEPLRPLWALPLQQFVYRQLMYLVVIQSVVSALIGVRLRWQKLRRTGDLTSVTIANG